MGTQTEQEQVALWKNYGQGLPLIRWCACCQNKVYETTVMDKCSPFIRWGHRMMWIDWSLSVMLPRSKIDSSWILDLWLVNECHVSGCLWYVDNFFTLDRQALDSGHAHSPFSGETVQQNTGDQGIYTAIKTFENNNMSNTSAILSHLTPFSFAILISL